MHVLFTKLNRKLEKEIRKSEKEAKKIEEKAARKQEKDAAKAEKMYRNTISSRSAISRSSERVGSRSGSLERRQSGDGEHVVLNQSTVHGKYYLQFSKTFTFLRVFMY